MGKSPESGHYSIRATWAEQPELGSAKMAGRRLASILERTGDENSNKLLIDSQSTSRIPLPPPPSPPRVPRVSRAPSPMDVIGMQSSGALLPKDSIFRGRNSRSIARALTRHPGSVGAVPGPGGERACFRRSRPVTRRRAARVARRRGGQQSRSPEPPGPSRSAPRRFPRKSRRASGRVPALRRARNEPSKIPGNALSSAPGPSRRPRLRRHPTLGRGERAINWGRDKRAEP